MPRGPSPHTPFIPPLSTPESSPQPPLLPQLQSASSSSSGPHYLPTTPSTPWNATQYPPPQGGRGPAQPYFPGFVPNANPYMTPMGPPPMAMGGATPAMGSIFPPYVSPEIQGYIPPGVFPPGMTPLPGGLPNLPPPANGFSYDWIGPGGAGGFTPGATPASAPVLPGMNPMQAHQAHAQAQRAAGGGYGGYPGFSGPTSAPVIPPAGWGQPGGGAPGPWGPAYQTPAAPMHQGLPGGGFGGGAGPWGNAAPAGGWGGMDPLTQGMAAMGLGVPRPRMHDAADRVDPFAEGAHYHPVLDPFIVKIVKAKLQLNPILLAPATSSTGHLNWNMLFPSSDIHFSKDPEHKSWSDGRDQPATFPRVTQLRIITKLPTFPWIVEVNASNPSLGVTCGEIIETLARELLVLTKEKDWKLLSPDEQKTLRVAYQFNRSRNPGAPGGKLKQGMYRLDFLTNHVWWGGLDVVDPEGDREYQTLMRRWLNLPSGVAPIGMPCLLLLTVESMSTRTTEESNDWSRSTRQRRASQSASRPPSRPKSSHSHGGGGAAPSQGWGGGGLGAGPSRSRAGSRAGSRTHHRPRDDDGSSDESIGIRVRGVSTDDSSSD